MPNRSHVISTTDHLSKSSVALATEAVAAPSPVTVPVLRPRLPSADQILPYLCAIDQRRTYSNGGPLCAQLQTDLARHLGCSENRVVTAASGTAGLTTALLALDLPAYSACLMPSWTFAATPHAALSAGMQPSFLDVDPRTWALDPIVVRRAVANASQKVGAVIVVSPFGAPIDITAWERFQHDTGIAVVVDAAAGFDTVRPSSVISVVSLHATKIFAAGEGGLVVAPTVEMRDRIRACGNFGFDGTRIAIRRAINSKMSEYHAAVALANLDCWPATRLKHLQVIDWYKRALSALPGVTLQPRYGEGWACGNTNVLLESDSAESISRYMLREGVETRMWWGAGCHVQPAFSDYERANLTATEYLGARVLGLPHFSEMRKADVAQVVSILAKALTSRATGRRRVNTA